MNILIKLTCLVGLVIAPILGGHGSESHAQNEEVIIEQTIMDAPETAETGTTTTTSEEVTEEGTVTTTTTETVVEADGNKTITKEVKKEIKNS